LKLVNEVYKVVVLNGDVGSVMKGRGEEGTGLLLFCGGRGVDGMDDCRLAGCEAVKAWPRAWRFGLVVNGIFVVCDFNCRQGL
jgi:hypothetical protein